MNSRLLLNFALFQLGWFACVLSAASQMPWLGTSVVAMILGYHLLMAGNVRAELQLIVIVTMIGGVWDSLLVSAGLLEFDSGILHVAIAPHWIIAMWALFASTLNVSMKWMKQRYLVAAVFGALGGPLAYYAGFKLGAVSMPSLLESLLALALGWAVIMPTLVWLSQRFNGFSASPDLNHRPSEVFHV